jgi:hypothetical protein
MVVVVVMTMMKTLIIFKDEKNTRSVMTEQQHRQ